MPTYQFTARNNYGEIETFSPYDSKREAHAGQDRLAEKGYTDFSAVTEQEEIIPLDLGDEGQDRQNYTDTQDRESYLPLTASIDCLPPIPVTSELRQDAQLFDLRASQLFDLRASHLPEVQITEEQEPDEDEEPESVDLIASGYDWTCPNCDTDNNVAEYSETVTCQRCGHTYIADEPIHPTG